MTPARKRSPEFSIDREARWHHRGTPIRREPLLRMLASMLRRDARGHFLATAEQRLPVEVADAPFLVTDLEIECAGASPRLVLVTELGARHVAGAQHPLVLRRDPVAAEWRLYQQLGEGLEALVHRHVFYRLAELAEAGPGGRLGVRSDGEFFVLDPDEP